MGSQWVGGLLCPSNLTVHLTAAEVAESGMGPLAAFRLGMGPGQRPSLGPGARHISKPNQSLNGEV